MGTALGTLWERAGHTVAFSYSRDRRKLDATARDAGLDPVDAGPLEIARYLEPFGLLMAQLAYAQEMGPELAYQLLRVTSDDAQAPNGGGG